MLGFSYPGTLILLRSFRNQKMDRAGTQSMAVPITNLMNMDLRGASIRHHVLKSFMRSEVVEAMLTVTPKAASLTQGRY